MATWRVGKTLVGFDKRQVDVPCTNERQAKYKLGRLMRTTTAAYRMVMPPEDPNGWWMTLAELDELATQLENGGEWPPLTHGLNWLWSLPWGADARADRDLFVFWAKCEGGDGGGEAAEVVGSPSPASGAEKELAGSASAA